MSEWGDSLDCRSCDDTLKAERGHDKNGIIHYFIDGKQVYRCPLTFITPLSLEYIKAFSFFEKGLLPNGNAWNEENHKFLQAMAILENKFNEIRNEGIKNAGHRSKHTPQANRQRVR